MIISKATDLLTLCARRRIKVLLKGKPGVGKTDLIRAVASACNMDLIMSHPSVSDPTDYKGLPVALAGKKGEPPTADFVPFGEMWRLIHAERPTIHFADDLGQAPHAVQAAYMQSLQTREVAGHNRHQPQGGRQRALGAGEVPLPHHHRTGPFG
jgi:MoxR-like ATPase